MGDKQAILDSLEEYADAYCAKDTNRLMALFADSDDISLIGTGSDELCAGQDQIREVFDRNFTEATATKFDWHWTQVTILSDSAVVAITLTIHLDVGGSPLQVPIRWTVSLARIGSEWKWMHRHASSAATSQDEGTAYPTGK